MKKSTIILSVISFLLLIIAILLGVFLLKSTSDTAKLQEQINVLENTKNEVSDLPLKIDDTDETPEVTSLNFTDVGLGINIEYPSDWKWKLDTKVSDDFGGGAYKEIYTYDLDFIKGSNKIEFSAMFGGVGDMGVQYPDSEYDTKVLNSKLIRVKKNGENKWRYVSKIPCTDAAEWDGVTDVCGAGGFFPGFAKGSASSVSFTGSDSLIEEVDAVVLTAVK